MYKGSHRLRASGYRRYWTAAGPFQPSGISPRPNILTTLCTSGGCRSIRWLSLVQRILNLGFLSLCASSVVCRLEAESYRTLPRADLLLARGRAIAEKYIAPEAIRSVPLSEPVRDRILASCDSALVGPGLFIEAQTQVRHVLPSRVPEGIAWGLLQGDEWCAGVRVDGDRASAQVCPEPRLSRTGSPGEESRSHQQRTGPDQQGELE